MNDKTATAAPKKRAKARFTVVNDADGKPIAGAEVEVVSQAEGKTDAKGVYTTPMFVEGDYGIRVFAAGFCPPETSPRREWTFLSHGDFPAATPKEPRKEWAIRLVQALPRAKVKVIDPSRGGAPVHGVEVEVAGQKTGRTGPDGVYCSPPFSTGKHVVKARKPGYGPAPGSSEGPHEAEHDFSEPQDTPITIEMVSLWGRVKSSNITVGPGHVHFVDWFNKDFRPRMPKVFPGDPNGKVLTFPGNLARGGFINVFDQVAKLYTAELTVEEFVAIFTIIYNETGGSFAPISEKGQPIKDIPAWPKYFFEANGKASYNRGGNRKAGDLLMASKHIETPEELAQWNSTTWPEPAPGSELYNAALECDFNKYRGRGLIQITFRSAYLAHVDPALAAASKSKADDLSEVELGDIILTDPEVYLAMVRSYLTAIRGQYAGVNGYDWRTFGLAIVGLYAKAYGDLYTWRCQNLFDELRNAGFELK